MNLVPVMSSAAREIHLKPVSVSAYCAPAAAAIFDSSVPDTIVVATSGLPVASVAAAPASGRGGVSRATVSWGDSS
jgi:hypothetical protein